MKSLAICERLAAADPNRADYQRGLSVSYERVGDLYRDLGDGEKARDALMKSLAIRERLAAAEPNRADYQVDVAFSLVGLGTGQEGIDVHLFRQAFEILLALDRLGKLAPEHQPKLTALKDLLESADT